MKKHVKIYLEYFGYGIDDFIPCERCGQRGADVHHIDARGMGGTSALDVIENLMGLCRRCHTLYGDRAPFMKWLKQLHLDFMKIKDS